MNYMSVYRDLNGENNTIKLLFELDGREYNLARTSTDSVGQTLKRIGLSVQKAEQKATGQRKGKGENKQVDKVLVQLCCRNGEIIGDEVTNSEAWCEGNTLCIKDVRFYVEENTPLVLSATIPSIVLCGFPVVPILKHEFADKLNSQYKWFKQVGNTEEDCEKTWTQIGQDFIYIPNVDDIGCLLKLSCKAVGSEKEAHKWYTVVASAPVSAGPGPTPFEARQLYTVIPVSDPNVIRVVSYNILADCYLEDDATCQAWFGYCPKYALGIDYRQQLLLKEILGYNGDLICLQECGRRMFRHYLSPVMTSKGYTGVSIYKTGVMVEGEAIFFRDSKFKLISQHDIALKDSLLNDPINGDILASIREVPKALEKILSRTTVAQLLVLQYATQPEKYLCVVNTHLYFRPNAPYVRNLQCLTILNHLKQRMEILENELQNLNKEFNIGVVFCGDFNSLPETALVQFLSGKPLESSHTDWIIPPEKGEPFTSLKLPTLDNPFEFQNCSGVPEFTTYTEGFKGVLDYIFASKDRFEVQSVIPMPSAEDLQMYTAIPSPVMSSDHLASICELKWKKSS